MNRLLLSYIHRTLPVVAFIMATAGCGMLTSCKEASFPFYSEFIDIDPEMWYPGNPAELTPWPRDSVIGDQPMDMLMSIRYTSKAPDTLSLAITRESFEFSARNDTLNFILRDDSKRPEGAGNFGIYTINHSLEEAKTVPDGFRISAVPISPVQGIISFGIILTSPASKN